MFDCIGDGNAKVVKQVVKDRFAQQRFEVVWWRMLRSKRFAFGVKLILFFDRKPVLSRFSLQTYDDSPLNDLWRKRIHNFSTMFPFRL